MAQPRQEETKDALDSIFDFIFAETQKPPDKRKPVKPTNISGSSEMVEAIATVLEKPGLYVSDQIAKDIEDGLNIQLTELYFGKSSPQGKTKIGTKDILSIIKDPNDFFNKAYKKSNPKFNMADWSGRTYRGLNAANWARKQGIKDKETRWALNRASASFDNPSQRLDMVRDGQKVIRKNAALTAVRNACSHYGVPGLVPALAKHIDQANTINSPADLASLLRNTAQVTDNNLINAITKDFGKQKFEKMDEKLIKGYKSKPFQGTNENIDIYRRFMKDYYTNRAKAYRMSGTSDDRKTAEMQEKIGLLIEHWRLSDKKNKEYLSENRKNLQNIRQEIRLLKKGGLRTPAEKAKLASLRNDEKKIKASVDFLKGNRSMDMYFKYKGMWKTMNSIYLKGNLAASILDGTFFSEDNKILNPVETDYKGTMDFKEGGATIFFNVAKDNRVVKQISGTNQYKVYGGNLYRDTMTHISYLTPQKLFQINGEYFAFRTYKNRTRLFKKMLRMSKDQTKLTQELISLGFITEDGHFNLDAFTGDPGKVRDRMNSLKSLIQNDKTLQKYFKNSDKVLKMLERYERMNKLLKGTTWIFSAGYRTQEWIKDRIADATLKKFRQKVGERWLARIAEDNIMGPAIKQWMEGAGVQALFRGVVEKVLLKIGFKKVGGLIFNAIAGAATGGLSTLFFWGFKIFAQIGVLMLVGLVFFLLSGVSFTNKLTTYAPVSYAMPGEVEQCSGFQPENLVNPDLVDIEVPPPSNSSCPFGDIYLACTQGYNPPRGNWSHSSIRNKKPVDLANGGSFYFYAPQYCDDGGCRVTGARPANLYRCLDHNKSAGDEVFFNDGRGNVFIIVHAKALVPIQQEVSGGQAVAYIYGRGELPTGSCWSGPHVHLEITHNGQYIDPLSFLQAMGCSVPSESQCTE